MTGVFHATQLLLVEMGSCKFFAQACSQTMIFLISASRVAEITGMNHAWHYKSMLRFSVKHTVLSPKVKLNDFILFLEKYQHGESTLNSVA
jgi:hypothetical protein